MLRQVRTVISCNQDSLPKLNLRNSLLSTQVDIKCRTFSNMYRTMLKPDLDSLLLSA